MPTWPLNNIYSKTTLRVACQHRPWATHSVGLPRSWHSIIAIRKHTQSNDVGHGNPLLPMDSRHGQITSGLICYHRPWAAHTVGICWAWHALIAFGQHTRSDDIDVACHHCLLIAHTEGRRGVWHSIIALEHHTW